MTVAWVTVVTHALHLTVGDSGNICLGGILPCIFGRLLLPPLHPLFPSCACVASMPLFPLSSSSSFTHSNTTCPACHYCLTLPCTSPHITYHLPLCILQLLLPCLILHFWEFVRQGLFEDWALHCVTLPACLPCHCSLTDIGQTDALCLVATLFLPCNTLDGHFCLALFAFWVVIALPCAFACLFLSVAQIWLLPL